MIGTTVQDIMHDFVESLGKGDIQRSLSHLTEDIEWVTPMGAFRGKDEVRRYLSSEALRGMKVIETGNGIIAEGNKAFYEHFFENTFNGKTVKTLSMCAYEFEDGKIRRLRTVFDRVDIAHQAASAVEKPIVNQIIRQTERMAR